MRARSAEMAANPTLAELRLKELLEPLGFEFQVPLEGYTKNGGRWDYIADAIKGALVVEVDGGVHKNQKGRDRRRGLRLQGEGLITYRVSNRRLLEQADDVLSEIKVWLEMLNG